MIININKKYIEHFRALNHVVGDTVRVRIGEATVIAIDGDTYTLETPNEERDKFVIEANEVSPVNISAEACFAMYDAGARFK